MLRRFFSTRGGGVVGERAAPAMLATAAALVGVARPTTYALAWGGASAVYGVAPLQHQQQLRLRSSCSSSPIRRRHSSLSAAALAHRRSSSHGGASSRRSRVVSSASKRSPSSATADRATEIQRRYSRDAASGPTASLGLRVHEEISARYAVAAALQRADSQQAAAAAPTPSATGSNPVMDVTLEGTDSHHGDFPSDGPAVVSEDGGTIVRKQPQKLTEKQAGRWVDERLQEAAMFRDPRP